MGAEFAIRLRASAVATSLFACINSANAIDLQWIRTGDREHPADGSPSPEHSAAKRRTEVPPGASMLDRYRSSGDKRPFAVEAWSRPAEGGRYYAARVARQCLAYRQSSHAARDQLESRDSSAPATAHAMLREACSGFTDDELTDHFRLRPDNSHTDPIAIASRAITAASRSGLHADKTTAVQSVLGMADPVLMDDLGIRVALYRNEAVGTYVYFDGTRYPVRDDPPIVPAFYLLPCALGLDCSQRDPALLLLCANTGQCFSDRFDKVAAETPGGRTGEKFAATMQWYEKLATAVKRKDASAFVERP